MVRKCKTEIISWKLKFDKKKETNCFVLKVLGNETDFSSLRSLQAIEKFLIDCSEDVKQR